MKWLGNSGAALLKVLVSWSPEETKGRLENSVHANMAQCDGQPGNRDLTRFAPGLHTRLERA